MVKILVFDFDGTVADTRKLYVDIIHDSLLKASYIYPRSKIIRALGPKLEESLLNIGKFDKKTVKKLSKDINSFITSKARSLKVCKNVKRTIKRLNESKKYKIILLTNSARPFADAFLKHNGMEKDFDMIWGSENFSTKEKAIKEISKKFRAKPSEIAYIADRVVDYKIARHAGTKIIIPYACSWEKTRISQKKYSNVRIKDIGMIDLMLK